MSGLLLDTHIWLWYAAGDTTHLSPPQIKRLDEARKTGGLKISAISVWEIGMQQARGRIQLSLPVRDWIRHALAPIGMELIALDAECAIESTQLPGEPHGDPADRFLIATARIRSLPLVTRDEQIVGYGKAGYVKVVGF